MVRRVCLVPVFITVRTASTRLPNKCLLPFGEGNVLDHVILRAKHYDLEPIICTTGNVSDDIVEQIASNHCIPCFRGSEKNKIKRWHDCCARFQVNQFHTIDADDPFFDGELVKQSFMLLQEGYDIIYPTKVSSLGAATVGFSLKRSLLNKICEATQNDEDTEMFWFFVERMPNIKSYRLVSDEKENLVRLTLDYEEDYWLLRSIQRLLGTYAARHDIDRLFSRNPDLYKINWFRNKAWEDAQQEKGMKLSEI